MFQLSRPIKHFVSTVPVVAFLLAMLSCNKQLDKQPESQLSDASFWKNANDLKLACNALYSYLPGTEQNAYDNRTDLTYGQAANEISDGSRVVTGSNTDWTNFYAAIRIANNILEKSALIDDDETLIDRYKAEACFFPWLFLF